MWRKGSIMPGAVALPKVGSSVPQKPKVAVTARKCSTREARASCGASGRAWLPDIGEVCVRSAGLHALELRWPLVAAAYPTL